MVWKIRHVEYKKTDMIGFKSYGYFQALRRAF